MRKYAALVALLSIQLLSFSPYSLQNRIFTLGTISIENVTHAHLLSNDHPTFGATTFDANGDSWPDILISNHGAPPTLYLSRSANSFAPAPAIFHARGLDHHTPVIGDMDNDGDPDLYFMLGAHLGTGIKANELYVNQGKGKPFLLSQGSGATDPKGRGRNAIWFDFDLDGYLDLLAVNEYRADGPNRLFHNNGNRTFSDAGVQSGLDRNVNTEGGALAADLDNDGDMDVVITSIDHSPYVFINNGDGTFQEEAAQRGISASIQTWAIGAADVNNDGCVDLYFTRGSQPKMEGALLADDRLSFMQSVFAARDKVDRLTFEAAADVVLNFQFADDGADPNKPLCRRCKLQSGQSRLYRGSRPYRCHR